MVTPVKGAVVILTFPFTNLTASKRRPALVLTSASPNSVIVAQITSQAHNDPYAIPIDHRSFAAGGIQRASFINIRHIFTAHSNLIAYEAGHLRNDIVNEAIERLVAFLKR